MKTLFFFLLVTQICFGQWYLQNSGTIKNLHAVHFVDAYNGWAVGDSGTILKTTDLGNHWILQTSETTENLYDVQFIDVNNGWAVGDSGTIIHTSNGGTSWLQQGSGTSFTLWTIFFIDGNGGWCTGWDGTILKTTNGGISWIIQLTPTTLPLYDVYFIDANIGFAGGGEWRIIYGSAKVFLKTTNGGENWVEQFGLDNTFGYGISFSDELNGIVVGGAREAIGPPWGRIHRTIDGGNSWELAFEDMSGSSYNSVALIDSNYVWAVGNGEYLPNGRIHYSSDKGLNWSSQGEFASSLNDVSFMNSSTGWAVGQNGTILHTTNGGLPVELTSFTATPNSNEVILNWTTATETNNSGFSIERKSSGSEYSEIGFVPGFGTTTEPKTYSYTDSKVSTGKYTYRLKQIDFDGSYEYSQEVEVEVSAPFEFLLEQNFPNPFNPNTTIKYSVPELSNVKLTLFNLLGEEVTTLVNEEQNAGNYSLEFNAANLPSGVYFYQLTAGEYTAVKKMILIK